MTSVLFLCTGNAARSVMAGAALAERRPDLAIETAGTLTVDGLPFSWRTRAALEAVGLLPPKHASRQAERAHVDESDIVIGLAPEHVRWVRREHPVAAGRTATLIRLTETLAPPPPALKERLRDLGLADAELSDDEEVVDPGGGEVDAFIRSAEQIVALVDQLARVL